MQDGRLVTWGLLAGIVYVLWQRGGGGPIRIDGEPLEVVTPGVAGAVNNTSSSSWIQQLGSSYYSTYNEAPTPFWCAPSSPPVEYHQMTEGGAIIQPPF